MFFRTRRLLPSFCLLSALFLIGSAASASAQSTLPKSGLSCTIRRSPASPGDIEFSHEKYAEAAELFRKEAGTAGADGERAHSSLIRSLLRSGKTDDAESNAKFWLTQSPHDAWPLLSMAEIAFHKGEIDATGNGLRDALKADFCNPQAHADYAKYLNFTGFSASAKTQLDIAHKLDPIDDEIGGEWALSQPPAARSEAIKAYIERTKFLTDKERESWQRSLDFSEKALHSACKLTSTKRSTFIPLVALAGSVRPGETRWGMLASFDGAARHLDLDTGASGLVLTRAAARSLGLVIEAQTAIGGFGEGKASKAGIANVKEFRVGDMVFQDCPVEVLAETNKIGDADGLIGSDVFRKFLVTLDYPGRVVKLDPLPLRPNQSQEETLSAGTDGEASGESQSDRFVDPSMSTWIRSFHEGHMLIIPVRMNNGPVHLFVVDTGNFTDLLSFKAAREVSKVEASAMTMSGMQGKDEHVGETGPVTLEFAGLKKPSNGLYVTDLSKLSHDVEIGGFLGIPTLHQLTIQIDYRDQLMKFTFDPSRVPHCSTGMVIADCY